MFFFFVFTIHHLLVVETAAFFLRVDR